MNSTLKQDFITGFFRELGKRQKYSILRNYESLPYNEGDDIDILINCNDTDARNNTYQIIEALGWQYYPKVVKDGFTAIVCFYTTSNSVEICQLDIFTEFLWRNNKYIDNDAVINTSLQYNELYCVSDKGAASAVVIIKELLGSGKIRKKYWDSIPRDLQENKQSFFKCLTPIYGQELVKKIYSFGIEGKIEQYPSLVSQIKRDIAKQRTRSYLSYSFNALVSRIKKWFQPDGKMIAFVGPDGSGKTTLIANEENYLERFFPHNSVVFHRRYEIFPELHTGLGVSSMKGKITTGSSQLTDDPKKEKKVKRSLLSKVATWTVVIYYTIEYMVGNIKANRLLRNRTLILYDRYYYDHFVQPTSRDLIWPMRKILLALIKKPDLIIHLIASGEIIFKRKQDLNREEIDIQNRYMSRILGCCDNVIDIYTDNRNADEVAAETFRTIISKLYGIDVKEN